jgi:Type II secretion system protein C
MPRQLVAVNVLLVAISTVAVVYMVRDITALPPATTVRSRPAAAPVAATAEEVPTPAGSFTSVASRNLFSPTRTEAPPTALAGGAAAPVLPKPSLYGVVLRDNAPIAYLEDPTTRRVAAYRAGDAVAGGTVQLIAADHVVLTRPEGRVEVRLSDPAKPRAPVPPTAGQPLIPGGIPGALPPGLAPPSQVFPQPPTAGLPPGMPRFPEGGGGQPGTIVQPPVVGQPAPVFPGRRPLPPNLRRITPGTTVDAPTQ